MEIFQIIYISPHLPFSLVCSVGTNQLWMLHIK